MTEPEKSIQHIRIAAAEYADATADEMLLEDERTRVKQAAIMRLVGSENPETGKPHSASSAEKVVELDDEYAAHRTRQRAAVIRTITARGQFEAAKQTATLCVGMSLASLKGDSF